MIETTLTGKTPDIGEENIKKLMTMFPEVVTEGKVDFEKLKQVLGEYVDDSNERYNFTWNGKGRALRLSQTPSLGTLRPCKEESKNWDTTQNLYIEGDNLEVLKLLQKSYYGKIKMIYIDPPFNTGNDVIYKNNFHDSLEYYKAYTGQIDNNGIKKTTNTEASGRYHTEWLNMMYPRLRLARNLLTNDGFIVIAIDHNELDNLIKICDEIYGSENRIGIVTVVHKPEGRNQEKFFGTSNEFALFYAKNKSEANFNDVILDIEKANEFKYEDEKGKYKKKNFIRLADGKYATREAKPNFWYPIYVSQDLKDISLSEKPGYHEVYPIIDNGVERTWKTLPNTFMELYKSGQIMAEKENSKIIIYEKMREKEVIKTHWIRKEYHAYHFGTKILDQLLGNKTFDFPKSVYLIIDILKLTTSSNDIILDFFSGSATTAHAVMELNAEDGGNRKFIMVQLPEPTDEKDEAYKAGYMNICEIGKERIRRAGEKIKEENKDKENIANLDIGFKVLKLDTSNIRKWQPDYDNLEQSLLDYVDNYMEGRTELDVVYEIMLKYGLDLTYPVDGFTIQQKKVYSIGFGMLMICLDDEITTEVAKGILEKVKELAPESTRVVFKDNGFKTDSNKTNIKEILKSGGIEEFITI
ncbi:site-specific DNA-methyltransferase [Aminobacterium mobile]|jgi:adenine-specific DNA-methyltransferase